MGIGIGGGKDEKLKIALRDALRAKGLDGIAARDIRVVGKGEDFAGNDPNNVVNHITQSGNGIQIEQSSKAREPGNRARIVEAIAEVYGS